MQLDEEGYPLVLDAHDVGNGAAELQRIMSSADYKVRFMGRLALHIEGRDRQGRPAEEERIDVIRQEVEAYLAKPEGVDAKLAARHWVLSGYRPGNPNPRSNFDDYGPTIVVSPIPRGPEEPVSFS